MARYKVLAETWSTEKSTEHQPQLFELQCADILDTQTNRRYNDGAYRVLVDGKAPRGKGGTAPFLGESSWSDGERFLHDLVMKAAYAR